MTSIYSIGEFEYKAPGSLHEALHILAEAGAGAMVLAGGTDLTLQMKCRQIQPSLVVDVKRIPELNYLNWSEDEGLRLGAAVPLSKLLTFKKLTEKFNILAQACSVIGSMQIKNRATVGGNICNAAPSADSALPLLCLGASAMLASDSGTRTILLEDFFIAPGKTAMNNNELLVEITVPTPPVRAAGCYQRHTTREEMDIAVAGAASYIVLSPQDETLQEVRIALGAVAPTPIRARRAEAVLTGKTATPDIIEEAAAKAAEEAHPISDLRGSANYRRELVKVLTRRTLKKSCADLGIKA
ncbi:FAD binding domain-containing protein [Chloroflexota bacterium]